MCIVFFSWEHSQALYERRMYAVSRPWARAVPLSISCLSVSAAIHSQHLQKKGHCQGLEGKVTASEVYLPKVERTQGLGEKGSQRIGQSEGVSGTDSRKWCLLHSHCYCLIQEIPLLNTDTRSLLLLIFHRVTSLHREPQGVLLWARPGAQWDTGGCWAQAGMHRHLPVRQRLHARRRPDPHLHHGGRRQAELEQAQTHLHW